MPPTRPALALVLSLVLAPPAFPQAALQPAAAVPPTLEQVRADMNIPSRSLDLRGQRDSVGFASTAAQMEKVWELSATPPAPDSFGVRPAPGVAGVVCPHDDYLYAGRVYRQVLPLVTARTVILVGVFHGYRRFGERDRLVFDKYRAWRAPDGPVRVSSVREGILSHLPSEDYVQSAAMHDSEHSLEALVYWLKHLRPDLEIVPILVPATGWVRMQGLADHLARAIEITMMGRDWQLGRDLAVVISTDGVHYGTDFKYVPYGDGGLAAYEQAVARDRALLTGPLSGALSVGKVRGLYGVFVNPEDPDQYRLTWCGRFAVPFGLAVLERLAHESERPLLGYPVAYGTSIGGPELPLRDLGLGATAPANLYHFVSYPAVAFSWERLR